MTDTPYFFNDVAAIRNIEYFFGKKDVSKEDKFALLVNPDVQELGKQGKATSSWMVGSYVQPRDPKRTFMAGWLKEALAANGHQSIINFFHSGKVDSAMKSTLFQMDIVQQLGKEIYTGKQPAAKKHRQHPLEMTMLDKWKEILGPVAKQPAEHYPIPASFFNEHLFEVSDHFIENKTVTSDFLIGSKTQTVRYDGSSRVKEMRETLFGFVTATRYVVDYLDGNSYAEHSEGNQKGKLRWDHWSGIKIF